MPRRSSLELKTLEGSTQSHYGLGEHTLQQAILRCQSIEEIIGFAARS
jgi:hypothetical protein